MLGLDFFSLIRHSSTLKNDFRTFVAIVDRRKNISRVTNLEKAVDVDIHSGMLRMWVEVRLEVTRKVIREMPLHVAENVALKLLEQVVEVEVKVAGTSSGILTGIASSVVSSALVRVRQNFIGWKRKNFFHTYCKYLKLLFLQNDFILIHVAFGST